VSGETTIVLDNRYETAYVLDVTLVSEPFEGVAVTYFNGTTVSYPNVSTVAELRRRATLHGATGVNVSGAPGARLEAGADERVVANVTATPRDPILIHLLYERDDPPSRAHWTRAYACTDPGTGFSPVVFTLYEDGSQQFDPECFYGTP